MARRRCDNTALVSCQHPLPSGPRCRRLCDMLSTASIIGRSRDSSLFTKPANPHTVKSPQGQDPIIWCKRNKAIGMDGMNISNAWVATEKYSERARSRATVLNAQSKLCDGLHNSHSIDGYGKLGDTPHLSNFGAILLCTAIRPNLPAMPDC